MSSLFQYLSFNKAKETLARTRYDIKQCVNNEILECNQDTSYDNNNNNNNNDKINLSSVVFNNINVSPYKEYLFIPPLNELTACSCDNTSTSTKSNNGNNLHLEEHYDVARDAILMALENPILFNAYRDKLDLYSMSLCDTLRNENLKLTVLNQELELRVLTLSAEVTDTKTLLTNTQFDFLQKQKDIQKDFVRIKTSRKLIESMKSSLGTEVENLKVEKRNMMKILKAKSDELLQQHRLNRKLQENLEMNQKIVDSAKEVSLIDNTKLSSYIVQDDRQELQSEVEKLVKSRSVLRSLNDVMAEELNRIKAENDDINSKMIELTAQLTATTTELDLLRQKFQSVVKEPESDPELKTDEDSEDQKSNETIIENIINNITTTMTSTLNL